MTGRKKMVRNSSRSVYQYEEKYRPCGYAPSVGGLTVTKL